MPRLGAFKTRNGEIAKSRNSEMTKWRNDEMILKIRAKVLRYNSSKSCCPIYSVWGRGINFLSRGGEGGGVDTFFRGRSFFCIGTCTVILLVTNFFTTSPCLFV